MNRTQKIRGMAGALALSVAGAAYAQSFGAVTNDKQDAEVEVSGRGFTAQVDIDADLFKFTSTRYSDAKERNPLSRRYDSDVAESIFGGINIYDDSNVSFGYNGDWYGGKFSIAPNNSAGGIKFGGIQAWLGFFDNKLKISAGNDIGYSYADSQGADAGLRVYDDSVRVGKDDGYTNDGWQSVDYNKNPDNITQDKGILLELDFNPLKIALASGGNFADLVNPQGNIARASNNEPVYGFNYQFGANAGYKIGEYAKANGAYLVQAKKDATTYDYDNTAQKIVAKGPDSEIWNHLFSGYVSVYPFGSDTLGITAGYAGVYIKYLNNFGALNTETAIPDILKSGINLTARYKTGKLTVKTDHNYSFWTDKNYKIFYLYKPDASWQKDYGLLSKNDPASSISNVTHTFVWNGIGASYQFTDVFEGSVYARNLLRTDKTDKYTITNTYFSVELKSIFHISPAVEAYAGIVYNYTGRTADKGLAESTAEFGVNPAQDTADFVNMIKIPVGITVKLHPFNAD